jgi:integrase
MARKAAGNGDHGSLTDSQVRTLAPPAKGNRIVYDGAVKGLGVRVTSAGTKSWVLNYRNARGVERRLTIGDATAWTARQARERAKELRREIDAGGDPLGERQADRAAPTVNDLADRFDAEHLSKRRPATQTDYRSILRLYVRPALGDMRVTDVRHADIERLHAKIAKTAPYRANRTVAVLGKMLALAVKWEMRETNPARGIERAQEEKRERFLTPAEIGRLAEALAAHSERTSANAIRLLLLTGARRSEALTATWDQFDIGAGVWIKPSAHTKQKKEHRAPLSAPALALLAELRAEAEEQHRRARKLNPKAEMVPYVFPGLNGKPIQEIKKTWANVCRKANITGARIHDLRHTYASILASSGLSLPVIGALLGHTQAQTTHRYAHLLDDPLRAAAERAGAVITGAGRPGGDVVPLPAGRRA